ncbi:MAG TPA: PASTA domain-containing protein [Acidimicrobiales bacterium]
MSGFGALDGSGRHRLWPSAWSPWRSNLVTWASADLIGALLTRQPGVRGLLYLAVGAGDSAWDIDAPTPDPSRVALTAEVARLPLTPGTHLTFDRATSTVRVALSLPPGLGTGPLREVGVFGGLAGGAADSGTLVNHLVHDRIDKAEGDRLDREVRLVLGDPLAPGARLLVGALLARWADGTGLTYVGLGRDGQAAARPEALRSEADRLPLSRRAMRYLSRDHAVEVQVDLEPGQGPAELAEIGLFGGPATANTGTGWLFARDTFPVVDRAGARRFRHRLRLTLVSETGLPVPDVTQRPLAQARTALVEAKLQVGVITVEETDAVAPDRVTAQSPAAGALVAEATPVALTVTAVPRVLVPAVVGRLLAPVVAGLAELGLVVAEPVVEQVETETAPGTVLSVSPVVGSRVPKGSTVTLTVAVAPRVTVPDVRGRPLAAARSALESQGLVVADPPAVVESDATPDTVVASDPESGADVARGSIVALTLAVPRTAAVPRLVALELDGARAALAAAGAPLLASGTTAPAGLDLGARNEREVARGKPTGVILSQDPAEGTKLPRYATVDVVVAVPASVIVPDLSSGDLAAAASALTAIGLTVRRVQARRSERAPGQVVAQEPAAGAVARVGDGVAVWVAAGALATVPSITGLALDAAREALTMVGLTLSVVAQQPGGERPGEVLGQDPRPGRVVPVGSSVGVTVAAGVPDLVGLTVEAAKAALVAIGLELRSSSRESDGPVGLVLSQSPAAGSPVTGIQRVTVMVSAPITVEVPDVGGLEPDAATVLLAERRLELAVRDRPVDADKAGTIVDQDPAAGARAPVGSTVSVSVAQKPVATVRVPDVRTLTADAAKAALSQVGLVLGAVAEQPSRAPAGTVIVQDPPPDAVVAAATVVSLVVAVATGLVEVPEVRGLDSDAANDVLAKFGLGFAIERRSPSDRPVGTVLAQDPAPGAKVPVGSTVSVVVAAGEGLELPDVVGRTRDEALAILRRLKLRAEERKVVSRRFPPGTVVAQDPLAGTIVPPGATITLGIAAQGILDPTRPDFPTRPQGPILRPPG